MAIINQHIGDLHALYHGDCVEVIKDIPDNSIALSVSSWPFSDQYIYSASYRDFGNVDNDDEFFEQMDFLIPDLLRVHVPGRIAAVHCKDRIVYGSKTTNGVAYVEPFSDKCRAAMVKHGWLFFGRITITTDVVAENQSTNRLTQKELKKDSSRLGVGMPEYVLLFRKMPDPGDGNWPAERCPKDEADYNIAHHQLDSNSYWRSSGNRLLYPWEADGIYNYQAHVDHLMQSVIPRKGSGAAMLEPIPSPTPWVWADMVDVDRINVANARYKAEKDEKHICPLQFDIIERLVHRYSNEGETVFDYFSGLGSVPHKAIEMGRKGIGIELKEEYYQWSTSYCQAAEDLKKVPTLFDLMAQQQEVV